MYGKFTLCLSGLLSQQGFSACVATDTPPQRSSLCKTEREREGGRERERGREGERENLNSKTLFYKDCSLGSVKNLCNN